MRRSYREYIDEFYSSYFDNINSLANVSKNELYRSNKKEIKRVIFNEPYTIVIWANGEKLLLNLRMENLMIKKKDLLCVLLSIF